MITEFILAWDANKAKLEEHLRAHPQTEYYHYEDLVRLLFVVVINPFMKEAEKPTFDTVNIHVIDDGEYQGDQLFLIPQDTYQPSPYNYVWTHQSYGSCSGCDLLQGIQCEGWNDEGLPSDVQVKEYMKLELDLLQRCRYMIDRETYWNEP